MFHYEIKVTICGHKCNKMQDRMATGQQQDLSLLIDKKKREKMQTSRKINLDNSKHSKFLNKQV